jgi:hypothetical protein
MGIVWAGTGNSLGLGQMARGLGTILPLMGPVGFVSGFAGSGAGAGLWLGMDPASTMQGGLPTSDAAALHGSAPDAELVPGTASLLGAWTSNHQHLMLGMG